MKPHYPSSLTLDEMHAESRARDKRRVEACQNDTLSQLVTGTLPAEAADAPSSLADVSWQAMPQRIPPRKTKCF